MREIKFRGKAINGDWVYGCLVVHKSGEYRIYAPDLFYIVDPKTVGQYTGLKDNSKECVCIYEGDIVSLSGIVIGNIYEMDKGETDIVVQDFGGKTWCKTYNEAILRGCRHSE